MSATLQPCPSCKATVSKKATACPHCGHAFKSAGSINPADPIHLLGIIIAVVFVVGCVLYILQATQ